MKNIVTLNVGLEKTNGTRLDIHQAINEISRAGLQILSSCVVQGEWEGKQEQTLVITGLAYDSPELTPRLYCASRALSQHCIAIYSNGRGDLIGDNPKNYRFQESLFHFHPEGKAQESPCEKIQRVHREKAASLVDGYTRDKFCAYLNDQLIPDLIDSGSTATAQDFKTARKFILG